MELDPRLREITERQAYPLVFATVSGAHLYGFASADSDWDLRGVHVLPIEQVAGLNDREETIEDSPEVTSDGFELDLVTHDIEKFMRLVGHGPKKREAGFPQARSRVARKVRLTGQITARTDDDASRNGTRSTSSGRGPVSDAEESRSRTSGRARDPAFANSVFAEHEVVLSYEHEHRS